MPTALKLTGPDAALVAGNLLAMHSVGRRTGRSTTMAARTAQARISRGGGWDQLTEEQQVSLTAKARSFGSWLMVTGQIHAPAGSDQRAEPASGQCGSAVLPGRASLLQPSRR
jgi:hypothetical protein